MFLFLNLENKQTAEWTCLINTSPKHGILQDKKSEQTSKQHLSIIQRGSTVHSCALAEYFVITVCFDAAAVIR